MQGLPPARPRARVLVAVGLVAGSTLALQVLLTRLFSAALAYHFGFLAISLALLGVGAGALLIYILPGRFAAGRTEELLARWSVTLAALLLVVPALLVRIRWPPVADVDLPFVLKLTAACGLSSLPFLAAGIVIALAVREYVASMGRLYAADLAGAALGSLLVVPLLWVVPAPELVVSLGFVAAIAGVLFGGGRAAAGLVAASCVLLALSGPLDLYRLPPRALGGLAQDDAVADRWSPLSRVVGYPPVRLNRFQREPAAWVLYDRDVAPVPLWRRGRPHPDWRRLELGPQSIGYALTGPGDALVIGGGGGRDIHNALSAGQRRVDVIELNRNIRKTVDEDLARWSGSPYSAPRVRTVIGDGRSTLAARDTKYDQIHLGFTNTLSGNAASSFALTEANLYTLEAFDEYFDHLRPGGVLNVSRLYRLTGEEALRATILTLEALARRGVEHPERNVVVVLGGGQAGLYGTVLARIEPYAPGELALIRRLARERGAGVAFAPGGPFRREWRLLAGKSPLAFCRSYREDVCPPTDDKPFFFNPTRLGDVGHEPKGRVFSTSPYLVLLVVLGILAALCAAAFAVPLAVVRPAGRPPLSALLFFAAIGVGFLVLEIVLIQRFVLFLGFPTYALSVVLFSLLLSTGLGSLLSGRVRRPRTALIAALATAAVLVAVAAPGLQPLLRALIDLPFAVRMAVTVALILPLGVTLGMAMPLGLGRLAGLYPAGVPWAWAVNGVTSVLGSVLAVAVAITWGFTAATLVALACYLGALAHVLGARWPEAGPAHPAETARHGAKPTDLSRV